MPSDLSGELLSLPGKRRTAGDQLGVRRAIPQIPSKEFPETDQMKLADDYRKIMKLLQVDPFRILGRHENNKGKAVVRTFLPRAESVYIAEGELPMKRVPDTDLFEWRGKASRVPSRYRLIWRDDEHREHIGHDPYCFPPQLVRADLRPFSEGTHTRAQHFLGARVHETEGVAGVLFSVWAPNARRASVVGDFNHWDGRCHPMRAHPEHGVWELFIPDLKPGVAYKYELEGAAGNGLMLKSDPYGRVFKKRPDNPSIVAETSRFEWRDQEWLRNRANFDWQHAPVSIFEVHLGSWQRGPEGEMLNYQDLAHRLVDYVKELGFTHIELMPVTEHPYDRSWGYQSTGYFAPTSRFGTPDDFRYFMNHCHRNGIGVILDWVPAHFPKDAHGLGRFDGTALYEHEDPRKGEHLDWSTFIFNYGRNEVKSFLLSSALFWLEEYHIDGLRVDAVASMLYLDYSRTDWIPNQYGGKENLEAIEFLRRLNEVTHCEVPGILMMAEESTSWPQVSRPTYVGGLGFDMKWNMGWMNDTLAYFRHEPIHRQYHHDMLTFSMLYVFGENFLLPLSHDEVVHGKSSLLNKMPGDDWQRFANLRLLYSYMFTFPGKKLLFMGNEFAQSIEWNSEQALDWHLLDHPAHRGISMLVRDLNSLYRSAPGLHAHDFEWQGFEWIDCHDAPHSVLSYVRRRADSFVVVVLNFTPVPRTTYRIGVPQAGRYRELFNSDADCYGGGNVGNGNSRLESIEGPWMGRQHSLSLTLPPLGALILDLDLDSDSRSV